MGILDENYEDKLQDDAKWALDRTHRTSVKSFHCTNIAMLTKYVYDIQQWIYEHWIPKNSFEFKSITELMEHWETCRPTKISMDSPYKDFMDDARAIGMDYSKCLIPIPRMIHTSVYFMSGLNDVNNIGMKEPMRDPSEKIALQMCNMTITTPMPIISAMLDPSSIHTKYLATWQAPCTLMLRDVVDIPSYIGKFIDDDVFLWNIPVDKVYLYNCPRIDPRFLKLPYVETFEEKGWYA